jgi:predicted dehydrogenase
MLNAAIVGLGWWGKELVRSVQGSSPRIGFSRAVTLEPDLAREFAAEQGLTLGTSYEEALADPKIEAVVLATPHTLHRRQVEAAARAGKHVYCEKPFALTKADAEAALAACRRAGVALGVGHNRRLWPSLKEIHRLIAAGALGTIMHAEATFGHDWLANQPAGHWRNAPEETKTGGMTGMGVHLLDAFSFLVGPMQRVAALASRRTLPLAAGDTTTALIEFHGGATGTLMTTLKMPYLWRLAVYGSDLSVESTGEDHLVLLRAGRAPEVQELPAADHIGENLESFAAAARGEGAYHISDAHILHTVAALEAVFRSAAAKGAWEAV